MKIVKRTEKWGFANVFVLTMVDGQKISITWWVYGVVALILLAVL